VLPNDNEYPDSSFPPDLQCNLVLNTHVISHDKIKCVRMVVMQLMQAFVLFLARMCSSGRYANKSICGDVYVACTFVFYETTRVYK